MLTTISFHPTTRAWESLQSGSPSPPNYALTTTPPTTTEQVYTCCIDTSSHRPGP